MRLASTLRKGMKIPLRSSCLIPMKLLVEMWRHPQGLPSRTTLPGYLLHLLTWLRCCR
jgi:hypothetical protein